MGHDGPGVVVGAPWEGVVSVPEAKVGTYEVVHFTKPPGEVSRSNMRTAIIGGQGHPPLTFGHETRWHSLRYEGGVWVTDEPIEQQQHDDLLEPFSGRVLVGGLGIGYAANVLAARDEIDEVVVVEISPEVVELVKPHLKDPEGKIEVVTQDLFTYLREDMPILGFDWAFFDIWQSDGEWTFFGTVCPLRELAVGWIQDRQVVCWNENVMRGQLFFGLQSRYHGTLLGPPTGCNALTIDRLATRLPDDDPHALNWNWSVPFFVAVKSGAISLLDLDTLAGEYAGTYGHPGWEEWWASRVGDTIDSLQDELNTASDE